MGAASPAVESWNALLLDSGVFVLDGVFVALTTAFLLSNVIFQFTNLRTALTQEVVTINKLGAVMSVLPAEQRVEAQAPALRLRRIHCPR